MVKPALLDQRNQAIKMLDEFLTRVERESGLFQITFSGKGGKITGFNVTRSGQFNGENVL